MLITTDNDLHMVETLKKFNYIGFDTETYGTGHDDEAFSLQLSCSQGAFYINLHDYEDGTPTLDRTYAQHILSQIFSRDDVTVFIHNAKFDLRRLNQLGVRDIRASIHCTQAVERILYNQHIRYSLDACLKRRGRSKSDIVMEYVRENKLYEMVSIEGKKKREKKLFYHKVPFDIMYKYGIQDAMDVLYVGMDQVANLEGTDVWPMVLNEYKLTKVCSEMERVGVKVDLDYIQKGKQYEEEQYLRLKQEASSLAGEEFKNGPKWLASAFDKLGQPYRRNPDTGNPIFDKSALAEMESPIANIVKDIRRSEKYIGTYYSSFHHYADRDAVVHANIRLAGTDTGRFSYSDPNLQNVPKEENFVKGDIQVRKCFIPRKDYCFVMIDFDQQEFRLMLDYAGDKRLIDRINEEGVDVHQATADLMRVDRKYAKTLNFGLLYGMGTEKLAKALGISQRQAQDLKFLYFSRMPDVDTLITQVVGTAKMRGYIRTWTNRKLYFPNSEYAYKAPNHLIQGGCSDIARLAMVHLHDYLADKRSRMLLQVHDEIVFEVHKDELDIVPHLKCVMESVYTPANNMKLTCGVEYSWTSWGKQDAEEGLPT